MPGVDRVPEAQSMLYSNNRACMWHAFSISSFALSVNSWWAALQGFHWSCGRWSSPESLASIETPDYKRDSGSLKFSHFYLAHREFLIQTNILSLPESYQDTITDKTSNLRYIVLPCLVERGWLTRTDHVNMCKRTYQKMKGACLHVIETSGNLIQADGCNNCGIEKGKNYGIGTTISHTPCDDCQAKGLWAQTASGKWYEVAEGGPQKFPTYKFPCQSSLQHSKVLLIWPSSRMPRRLWRS